MNITTITEQESSQKGEVDADRRRRAHGELLVGKWGGGIIWSGGPAALTLQREWVRCRGELMSLGVEERSPSAAEASEMTEGWRE